MVDAPSYLLKLSRAHDHLEHLETEIQGWMSGNHHSVVTKRDPKRRGYFVVLATADAVPFDPFALLIGDILQNLRSGLDHLAYRLTSRYTIPLPPEIAEESEFPIFGDVDRKGTAGAGSRLFGINGLRKIRGTDPSAQAIIESLQPYHRGNDFTMHPLWMLHQLSRIDKHRLLHPVVSYSGGVLMDPELIFNAVIGPGTISVKGGLITTETVIVRYPAQPVDPRLKMKVDFQPALEITFPDGSVAARQNVISTLAEIYNYVANEVLPRLDFFL